MVNEASSRLALDVPESEKRNNIGGENKTGCCLLIIYIPFTGDALEKCLTERHATLNLPLSFVFLQLPFEPGPACT